MRARDVYNLRRLLVELSRRGVQLWANRGRLYYGPLDQVDAADRALLVAAKADIIALLQTEQYPVFGAPWNLIAPVPVPAGGYAGKMVRKPWDYEVAIVLPTFGRLDLVETAVVCWRRQTVSPYLIVVQTGPAIGRESDIEELRDVDCEVHTIAAHGWRHSSAPVSAALDLGFAVCQTNAALLTHVDVFPRHDHVIEDLLPRLTPSCPVIGYQVSRRTGSDEWTRCVSHTLTLCDMRVMRRVRACWNLLAVLEEDGEVEDRYMHWPDTETQFGRSLHAAGIVPEFLGSEPNAPVYANEFIVHWRSAPSVRHYLPGQAHLRHPGLSAWLEQTVALGVAAPIPPEVLGDDQVVDLVVDQPLKHPAKSATGNPEEPRPEDPGPDEPGQRQRDDSGDRRQ
jgi:hypothetical protein